MIPRYLLVVAGSGRMLAQAAKKAGFKTLVIDLFADLDTQMYAQDFCRVPSLSTEHLAPAVERFIQCYGVTEVVYGSGLESHPKSLVYLQSRLRLLGNAPSVFNQAVDKSVFYSLAQELKIPFPDLSFSSPELDSGWLVKPRRGQGGLGIRFYQNRCADVSDVFWQRYQPGIPHSALFIANGKTARIVGFHRQWTTRMNAEQAFVFAGIINRTALTDSQKQQIQNWLAHLTPRLGLRGVNSLDFIQAKDTSWLLEINPRPPASMQLYDADLLTAHIQASQGLDYAVEARGPGCSGIRIVYADNSVVIPETYQWPENVMDLPGPGSLIGKGQPICSIIAHQTMADAVIKQLLHTQHTITKQLERFQTHAMHG